MKVSVRMFDFMRDKAWFEEWHNAIGCTPPVEAILPAIGSVVEINDSPYGVGFLYQATDCPVSVIEWITIHPSAPPALKHIAVSHVIDSLVNVAKAENRPFVMLAACDSITKMARSMGFVTHETGVNLSTLFGGS